MRTCPYCAEDIEDDATSCPWCDSELTTPSADVAAGPPRPLAPTGGDEAFAPPAAAGPPEAPGAAPAPTAEVARTVEGTPVVGDRPAPVPLRAARQPGAPGTAPAIWSRGGRRISPALFATAILCFFLPFVGVSCGGAQIATFKGVHLAFGFTFEGERVGPEPLASLALLAAVAGLVVALVPTRKGAIWSALMGAVGAVLLLALRLKLDADVRREGEGIFAVSYLAGYWLSLLLLVGASALSGYAARVAPAGPSRPPRSPPGLQRAQELPPRPVGV